MSNKAIFLDRDDTLIEDPGYLSDPEQVKLLPGVDLALKSLHQAGYMLVVASNQSGVARGLLSEETLEEIHAELRRKLAEGGAHIDAIYYCPHHPQGTVEPYVGECEDRKPAPGMLVKAAAELDIDLEASWMVGDGARDVEAGQRAGCRTVRLRHPGSDAGTSDQDENVQADFTVRNLVEAAKVIQRESANERKPQPAPADDPSEPGLTAIFDEPARQPAVEASVPAAPPAARPPAASPASQSNTLPPSPRSSPAQQQSPYPFRLNKFAAGVSQSLAVGALAVVLVELLGRNEPMRAAAWAGAGLLLQVMALTLYTMRQNK
jgi:D,D-heptose 1,7-bisphosphate phosphatase